MKRTSMRKPLPPRTKSVPQRGTGRGAITTVDAEVRAVPKGVTAKPGKRAPTAEESQRMEKVAQWGCVACRLDGWLQRPAAIHHILRGGRRMGHRYTIGLCDPGHHQNGAQFGLVSRHPWKARFEAKYGDEMQLLALTDEALGYPLVTM